MTRFLSASAMALALSACAVGPDYVAPESAPGAAAGFDAADEAAFVAQEPPGQWWALYDDPVLDALIEQALAANTDLRVAAANLDQARAALREVRQGQLPQTTIDASAAYARQSAAGLGLPEGQTVPETEIYDAGLDVGYQLDLFGRIRRAVEAGRADYEAVQAAYDLARITVAAETARAYADACNAGLQLDVARRSVSIQEQTFDLTRRLVEGGRATALDSSQAGALLDQTRAEIPTLEGTRQIALYRLAVLTGRPPAEFPREVAQCDTPPRLATAIPVGDGASLLARRPDIRAAERRLAAATARIGVATAELYPDISLGGSIGTTATSLGDLGSDSAFNFSLGPLISWSFPNIGTARARIAQAEAVRAGALAEFDGTWLGALQETESALTRYARGLERTATLRSAVEQSQEAARIARLRYEGGRESFQVVLDAERQLTTVEASLAQAEGQLANDLIALFLALGGGWE